MAYSHKQPRHNLPKLIFGLLLLWLLGFALFLMTLPEAPARADYSLDAAVVLTGGPGRVAKGAELLRTGQVRRLLISGAHDSVNQEAIRRRHNLSSNMAECCLRLDRAAHNTASNARRSRDWLRNNDAHSIVLITDDYHMPRALMLFRDSMPATRIIPLAITSKPDWLNRFREYNKLLLTWVSLTFGGGN